MKRFIPCLLVALTLFLPPVYGENGQEDRRYRIAEKSDLVSENRPFVVIILSYNNAPYVEKNLLSVLNQEYDNFRILYFNDASTDGTSEKIEEVIRRFDPKGVITLIENRKNEGAMHNIYQGVRRCKNKEIVVTVDGDDFLAHPHVLKNLNAIYANPDVWMTYGSYVDYPFHAVKEGLIPEEKPYRRGIARPLDLEILKERGVRGHPFVTTHLRTFYAGLFKRIKMGDFLDSGKFLWMTHDVAYMLPLVELAGGNDYFVEEILYLYNVENPISDFRTNQKEKHRLRDKILAKLPYAPLEEHPKEELINPETTVDLIITSRNSPRALYAFLASLDSYAKNVHQLLVFYESETEADEEGYREVKKRFPEVVYAKDTQNRLVEQCLLDREASCVLFASDHPPIESPIDFREGALELVQTGADTLYYDLGTAQKGPLIFPVDENKGVYGWQFNQGEEVTSTPPSPLNHMALFCKKDLRKNLSSMRFDSLEELEEALKASIPPHGVGLYYKESF